MVTPGPRDKNAGPDSLQNAIAAAEWTGISPTSRQRNLLAAYREWLVDEAIPAGGIGPNEGNRIWRRHIADSLLYGYGLREQPVCLDAGSGVGLPGIPLAMVHPQTHFDLVDKSRRRCDLMTRAIGLLGLTNCSVIHSELGQLGSRFPFVVSRAAIPADVLMIHVKHLLDAGGTANISVSRSGKPTQVARVPAGLTATTIPVPYKILDTKVQLLRIETI
jgi:16S rRNA (guanine527-N7)-methyltransferase